MKKLALYVEGLTEQLFVQSLVEFCAVDCNVNIESKRGNLGRKIERIYMEIEAKKLGIGDEYFVLIVDCGSDESVVSDIVNSYENLIREEFSLILGLRDVRPEFSRDEVDKLRAGMESSVAALNPDSPDGLPV